MTLVWALRSQASISLSVQWLWQLPSPCAPVPHRGPFLRAAARGLWAVWRSRGRVTPQTVRKERLDLGEARRRVMKQTND